MPQLEKEQQREALISERMHNEKLRLLKSEQDRQKYHHEVVLSSDQSSQVMK